MLLLFLTFTVCMGLAYPMMPQCFQLKAGSSVTLEWAVSEPARTMHCLRLPQNHMFLNLDQRYHHPQHGQFVGRVHGDEALLQERRIRITVSPVQTRDQGRYLCAMATECGRRESEFCLTVTERGPEEPTERLPPQTTEDPTEKAPEPQTEPEPVPEPVPESRGRWGLVLTALLLMALLCGGAVDKLCSGASSSPTTHTHQ